MVGVRATVADALTDTITGYRRRYPAVAVEYRRIAGEPQDVLIELSRSAELVVVGARGDEPWRGMLGEVSQSLLYHSPAPVLVVRGTTGPSSVQRCSRQWAGSVTSPSSATEARCALRGTTRTV